MRCYFSDRMKIKHLHARWQGCSVGWRSVRSVTARSRRLSPRALAVTRHLVVHGPESRGQASEGDRSLGRIHLQGHAGPGPRGLVSETLDPQPSIGRRRQILSAVPGARHVVGVKLTGDTAYGVAWDLFGEVLARPSARSPRRTLRRGPFAATVRVLARLVRRLARRLPTLDAVGVSIGGVTTGAGRPRRQLPRLAGCRPRGSARRRHAKLGGCHQRRHRLGPRTALVRSRSDTLHLRPDHGRRGPWASRWLAKVTWSSSSSTTGTSSAHSPIDSTGPRCDLGHRGCAAAYLSRLSIEARVSHERGRPVTFEGFG